MESEWQHKPMASKPLPAKTLRRLFCHNSEEVVYCSSLNTPQYATPLCARSAIETKQMRKQDPRSEHTDANPIQRHSSYINVNLNECSTLGPKAYIGRGRCVDCKFNCCNVPQPQRRLHREELSIKISQHCSQTEWGPTRCLQRRRRSSALAAGAAQASACVVGPYI